MPKPQVTSGVNCRLAKRVWGEPSRIAIQTLLRLTEAYGVSVAKGDPRAAAPADPSRYTAAGEGEGSGVSQSRAAGRAEVRLCNPVAQNARTPEGGVQARGGATSDRQGDRAVGNAVFQVLQEPTGRHRAGAGDCFVDARWSKGAWLLSGDDLRRLFGWRKPGRLRQPGLPSLGPQSDLHAAAEFSAPGVLAADSEGVVTSPIPRKPRIRLDWDSYRRLCQEVLRRDGWRCQRCGSCNDLQVHHMQPRSLLGGDVEENLITLCSACHQQVHLGAEAASRPERGME